MPSASRWCGNNSIVVWYIGGSFTLKDQREKTIICEEKCTDLTLAKSEEIRQILGATQCLHYVCRGLLENGFKGYKSLPFGIPVVQKNQRST